jgi:ABC-2 type transport system permease protein
LPLNFAALAWLADALLHLACWTAIAGLIAATCRSLSASLATAGTVWVGAVVVLPALLNLAVATAYPVPEGLALTVRQRQETHAGWDRPKPETFAQFFRTHPEWRDTAPVTVRFAWKWYYAMHQVGDTSVSADAATYRAHLLARAAATERLAWFVPPVAAQLLLSRRAGTDLESHLAYLDRIRAYHAQLQDHFLPLVFAEKEIAPADYAMFPRFQAPQSPASAGTALERLPLLLATFALAALSLRAARRIRP